MGTKYGRLSVFSLGIHSKPKPPVEIQTVDASRFQDRKEATRERPGGPRYATNVLVRHNGKSHICELQLHLHIVLHHKEITHHYYEFFRVYFKGNMAAADDRIKLLMQLASGGAGSLANLVHTLCDGERVEELEGVVWAKVVEGSVEGNRI